VPFFYWSRHVCNTSKFGFSAKNIRTENHEGFQNPHGLDASKKLLSANGHKAPIILYYLSAYFRYGKTVGIIGTGKIGTEAQKYSEAWDAGF